MAKPLLPGTSGTSISLTLFFTRGLSLGTWQKVGMLDRELAIYARLQERGLQISFVTYGRVEEHSFADRLPGLRILCNRWSLPTRLYQTWIPVLHGRDLSQTSVFKTNQTEGGDVALRAARRLGKPLIARCGYMWSEFAARQRGEASRAAMRARRIEGMLFQHAERLVVTTPRMRDDVVRRVPAAISKCAVIPNYVDVERFCPSESDRQEREILFVGRLSQQKNVNALLEAVQTMDARLTMIGDGPLRDTLRSRFGSLDGRVRWMGNVPNSELPRQLNRATLFVLPSLYEGHPKALLEAMACGLPVVATDVPGIREVVRHGDTGYLCGTSASEIRSGIERVLAEKELRERLGRNARAFVEEHCALDRVAEMELALIKEVLGETHSQRAVCHG